MGPAGHYMYIDVQNEGEQQHLSVPYNIQLQKPVRVRKGF